MTIYEMTEEVATLTRERDLLKVELRAAQARIAELVRAGDNLSRRLSLISMNGYDTEATERWSRARAPEETKP